ncbi:MAG: hypothetical protein JXB10_09635 [Pirellulales bacterium]|nr:hypothetical protein [Pirellulales bacterium]
MASRRTFTRTLGLEGLEERRLLSVGNAVDGENFLVDTAWIDGGGPSSLRNLDLDRTTDGDPQPSTPPVPGSGNFDVYVEPGLLAGMGASLDVYVADLTDEGYSVLVKEFSGNAAALRADLQNEWTTKSIEGALFVGDLPYVMFTTEDNFNETPAESTYPHDLYFMDLDGQYTLNAHGPDYHTAGSGDVGPEIYVSRITTGNLGLTGKSETTLINEYFAKVHAYRTGLLSYQDRGIVFADDDWSSWGAEQMDGLYDEYLVINSTSQTTKAAYMNALDQDYESILECIHSWPQGHSVSGTGGGTVYNTEILAANPRPGFYNMFNCSSARFTESNHLIGTYVYGGDYGLNAVGSTKTGSMLYFSDYYSPQAANASVGEAFESWFDLYAVPTDNPSQDWMVDWFYGMTMQGDPTLRPHSMGDPGDRDFGDAPTSAQSGFSGSYPTLLADAGAWHNAVGPTLGENRDPEDDGQPTVPADGDDLDGAPDDEDGVAFINWTLYVSDRLPNTSATVEVDLENAGSSNRLDAWVDFNRDGDWDDPDEQIFANFDLGAANGVQSLSFTIPRDTGANVELGATYARFRLSTAGGLAPTGAAEDGEVEDYELVLRDTTCIWDGGGTDGLWTTPENWDDDLLPMAGGTLIFPAGSGDVIDNDFDPGTVFDAIILEGGGYQLEGNAVALTSGLTDNAPAGSENLVALSIGGEGGITKNGGGTLTLTGENSCTGATLVLGGGVFTGGIGSSAQPTTAVTVENGAVLTTTSITTGTLTIGGGGEEAISPDAAEISASPHPENPVPAAAVPTEEFAAVPTDSVSSDVLQGISADRVVPVGVCELLFSQMEVELPEITPPTSSSEPEKAEPQSVALPRKAAVESIAGELTKTALISRPQIVAAISQSARREVFQDVFGDPEPFRQTWWATERPEKKKPVSPGPATARPEVDLFRFL